MNPDLTAPLLQKLCELQQQQIDKLAELSIHLSETAAATRKSYEGYQHNLDESTKQLSEMATESRKSYEGYERQLAAYEQALSKYMEDDPTAMRRAIIIASMLGLIAVSIIVSRFL